MKNKTTTFTLQSELTVNNGGTAEKNLYETILLLEKSEQDESDTIIYDKELKMHFIGKPKITTIYEIELYEIYLNLSDRLEKASDFTRRLMLRYDWIQPKVNDKGKVVSVQNTEELKNTWQRLKKVISDDYEGDSVEDCIKEIEENRNLLNRANWVYGEGEGNFPDHYAHAIKNLKQHGVWGPANKPFAKDVVNVTADGRYHTFYKLLKE